MERAKLISLFLSSVSILCLVSSSGHRPISMLSIKSYSNPSFPHWCCRFKVLEYYPTRYKRLHRWLERYPGGSHASESQVLIFTAAQNFCFPALSDRDPHHFFTNKSDMKDVDDRRRSFWYMLNICKYKAYLL